MNMNQKVRNESDHIIIKREQIKWNHGTQHSSVKNVNENSKTKIIRNTYEGENKSFDLENFEKMFNSFGLDGTYLEESFGKINVKNQ